MQLSVQNPFFHKMISYPTFFWGGGGLPLRLCNEVGKFSHVYHIQRALGLENLQKQTVVGSGQVVRILSLLILLKVN